MREDFIDIIANNAQMRRKAFKDLDKNLEKIKNAVKGIDSEAEIYLFGSVARGENTFSSDIDILILSEKDTRQILSVLADFGPPFEFHIYEHDALEEFKKSKLVKIC